MIPHRPRQMTSQRRTFAIVASRYNAEFVDGLMNAATAELEALSAGANIIRYEVPGAFEIPLIVQEVAERGGIDAIIALGVIIQGETQHAQLIGEAVTRSLLDCGLRYRIPVIHEVLLVQDAGQARRRCLEPDLNRGTEAARIAVRALEALSTLRSL